MIGCSARVFSLDTTEEDTGFTMRVKAADRLKAFLRIRLPKPVVSLEAEDEEGRKVTVTYTWDEDTRTELFSYDSSNQEVSIRGLF